MFGRDVLDAGPGRSQTGAFVPQQSHVGPPVHRVTEDVALQRGTRLLDPQEDGVTGPQADLDTHTGTMT